MKADKRIALITGGTDGIGAELAVILASEGWHVIILGRSEARGAKVARRARRDFADAMLEWCFVDLSAFDSVRRAASELTARFPLVHLLVNNAGARFDTYAENPDGIEMSFAMNHLGHFLLTGLIAGSLNCAERSSVMTLSSRRHYMVAKPLEWISSRDRYERWEAYSVSKLANTSFGIELARRWAGSGVLSNVFDPGIVATSFARNNGLVAWGKHLVSGIRCGELISSRAAARMLRDAVDAAEHRRLNGAYLIQGKQADPSPYASCAVTAAQLWELSHAKTNLQAGSWEFDARERAFKLNTKLS